MGRNLIGKIVKLFTLSKRFKLHEKKKKLNLEKKNESCACINFGRSSIFLLPGGNENTEIK